MSGFDPRAGIQPGEENDPSELPVFEQEIDLVSRTWDEFKDLHSRKILDDEPVPVRIQAPVLRVERSERAEAERKQADEPPPLRIGEITLIRHDVFDTRVEGENKRAYRFANRLHRRTREPVVERLLLFAPGQAYDPALLDETARLLRAQGYLREAEVRAEEVRSGR